MAEAKKEIIQDNNKNGLLLDDMLENYLSDGKISTQEYNYLKSQFDKEKGNIRADIKIELEKLLHTIRTDLKDGVSVSHIKEATDIKEKLKNPPIIKFPDNTPELKGTPEFPFKTEEELKGFTGKATNVYINKENYEAVYMGEFKNGTFEGEGKFINSVGTLYEGEFKNGTCEGKGKLKDSNGTYHEGEFKNGTLVKGLYITSEGYKYEGERDEKGENLINGTYKNKDGKLIGEYKNGKYTAISEKPSKKEKTKNNEIPKEIEELILVEIRKIKGLENTKNLKSLGFKRVKTTVKDPEGLTSKVEDDKTITIKLNEGYEVKNGKVVKINSNQNSSEQIGEVATKKGVLNIRDENGVVIGYAKKGQRLVLVGGEVDFGGQKYVGIKMADNTTGYVAKKFIKGEYSETKDDSKEQKEQLEKAKQNLSSAIELTKKFETDSTKLEKQLQEAHKKVIETLVVAEKVNKDPKSTLEDINKALEELKKAQANYEKIAKELAMKAEETRKKIEAEHQKAKSEFDSKITSKVEKGETVKIAEYKVTKRNEHLIDMDTPGRKYKDGVYYVESIYENDFELYKKDGKYILKMNTSAFSSEKFSYEKMPTKEMIKSKIDEMSKKYMIGDSGDYQLTLNF